MKRALILLSFLLPVSLLFLSCGSSPSSSGSGGSGLKFRAFISNVLAGVQIIDAEKDVRAQCKPFQRARRPA